MNSGTESFYYLLAVNLPLHVIAKTPLTFDKQRHQKILSWSFVSILKFVPSVSFWSFWVEYLKSSDKYWSQYQVYYKRVSYENECMLKGWNMSIVIIKKIIIQMVEYNGKKTINRGLTNISKPWIENIN